MMLVNRNDLKICFLEIGQSEELTEHDEKEYWKGKEPDRTAHPGVPSLCLEVPTHIPTYMEAMKKLLAHYGFSVASPLVKGFPYQAARSGGAQSQLSFRFTATHTLLLVYRVFRL